MTYTPDITRYQQLHNGDPYGGFNCTAWAGAILVDAHTQGATKTTGTAIRYHSNEVPPDPKSPGLNLPQVDTSVYTITAKKVDLDTKVEGQALTRSQAQAMVIDGRWATVQINRAVLVNRGFATGFMGGHAITVHNREIDNIPVAGDPLVNHYFALSWDALWDAAESFVRDFAPGKVYTQFTRDLTPDYRVRIMPTPPYRAVTFEQFFLNAKGQIARKPVPHTITGLNKPCTRPMWHGSVVTGVPGRKLVQFRTNKGTLMWVDARYAYEVYP